MSQKQQRLAATLAEHARNLKTIIHSQLLWEQQQRQHEPMDSNGKPYPLLRIYENLNIGFREQSPTNFADDYAQSVCYVLFTTKLRASRSPDFSLCWQKIHHQLPTTTPFLTRYFHGLFNVQDCKPVYQTIGHIFTLLNAWDIPSIFSQTQDPIVHFYELFLSYYAKDLRKKRGVFYTPQEVVDFIIEGINSSLIQRFGLADGIADTSDWQSVSNNNPIAVPPGKQKAPFIEFLEPAAGTGTFLVAIVKRIRSYLKAKWKNLPATQRQQQWRDYLCGAGMYHGKGLLNRLHAFEIMMTPYIIAHLRIGILLQDDPEMPFVFPENQRLGIYLSNALVGPKSNPEQTTTLEAQAAERVKRDARFTVVMGNPPYQGESRNKDKWIMDLMVDYKKEPGGVAKLKERNPKWINDDYVKFIRCGQFHLERSGAGILGFINPHGFLDNPTFRGMRWSLLMGFDQIEVVDLHGNGKKKERCPDGSRDANVFDILQGVCILFMAKTQQKQKDELAQMLHFDLYGLRERKVTFLSCSTPESVPFQKLQTIPPQFFMVPKDYALQEEYERGFSIKELFGVSSVGVVTSRDTFVIDENKQTLSNRIQNFFDLPPEAAKRKWNLKEKPKWTISEVQSKGQEFQPDFIQAIDYRPFDTRFVYYHREFIERPRTKIMENFIKHKNLGITLCRQFKSGRIFHHAFVTDKLMESCYLSNRTGEISYVFPLYRFDSGRKTSNLNEHVVSKIKTFCTPNDTMGSLEILDYVYSILHSPSYRKRFSALLQIDFARIPFPTDEGQFRALATLGARLRNLHLLQFSLETESPPQLQAQERSFFIDKIHFAKEPMKAHGRLSLNPNAIFLDVPCAAWEFQIGAYKPAQKWLNDRKKQNRPLTPDDIVHFQKLIVALRQTVFIQQKIDVVLFE